MNALCQNCLEYGEARGVNVGPEKGSRDPYRESLTLCTAGCAGALENGDLATFHARSRRSGR